VDEALRNIWGALSSELNPGLSRLGLAGGI
jgi:hypothetical protein